MRKHVFASMLLSDGKLLCHQLCQTKSRDCLKSHSMNLPRGGGYITCGWTGVCRRLSEKYSLLIAVACRHIHFHVESLQKTTHFWLFFASLWITHPCLRKICRKRDPCLENFGPRNPPIWAAHTRTLNMLCSPTPEFSLCKRLPGVFLKRRNRTVSFINKVNQV